MIFIWMEAQRIMADMVKKYTTRTVMVQMVRRARNYSSGSRFTLI